MKGGLPQGLFVAAHVTRIYGPVQGFLNTLRAWKADFDAVLLPFSFAGLGPARRERYRGGALAGAWRGHESRGWEPWVWARDFLFVLRQGWQASRGGPLGLFIGIDNLNALAGLALRALGRARRVAYYVIDYTPRRFGNPLLNAVYQAVERLAARHSDVVWNLSRAMQARQRGLGVEEARNQVLPVGLELSKVRHPRRGQIRRKRLVYMGALMKSKGVQLLIQAMPAIQKRVKGAELHIIGLGDYEAELRRLAAASPAAKSIVFRGSMAHDRLFAELPRYGVAFATYLEDQDSYTRWADPTKPKEYLACGLPLVITKVPWTWKAVADRRKPMGVAIDYNQDELVRACVKLLGDARFYWRCRRNALEFASRLDWKDLFARAFDALPWVRA